MEQRENRTITHLAVDKYFKWFFQKNIKDVELERINDKKVRLTTDLVKDEIFTKTAIWRVFLYKYLFIFLIACCFLVELNFSLEVRRSDNNIPILVALATIFNAFLFSTALYINSNVKNIEKNILLLLLVVVDAYVFFIFDIYIEFMMSMLLSVCLLFINILVKDVLEKNYKNTYFSSKIKASFCYKENEVSYVKTILISLVVVTIMLLVVQK